MHCMLLCSLKALEVLPEVIRCVLLCLLEVLRCGGDALYAALLAGATGGDTLCAAIFAGDAEELEVPQATLRTTLYAGGVAGGDVLCTALLAEGVGGVAGGDLYCSVCWTC